MMASKGFDSPESGFLVEAAQSDGDTASLVSGGASTGSATLEFPDGVSFHDLVDLKGGTFCRVVMKGDRGKPPRVCGTPSVECRRANHAAKRGDTRLVAPEGWYVRYGRKNGYPDGREDLGRVSDEEAMSLKEQAHARDKADLEAFLPPTEEVVFEEGTGPEEGHDKDKTTKDELEEWKPAAIGAPRRSARLQASTPPSKSNPGPPTLADKPGRGVKPEALTDKKSNSSKSLTGVGRRVIRFGGEETLRSSPPTSTCLGSLVYLLTGPMSRVTVTGNKSEAETLVGTGDWSLMGAYSDMSKAAEALANVNGSTQESKAAERRTSVDQSVLTPPRGGTWYGLVSEQGTKSLVTSENKVAVCRAAGFACEAVFEDEGEAKAWKALPTPPKTVKGSNQGTMMYDPIGPLGNVPKAIPYTDTSTAGDEVYGIKINRAAELDGLLLPAEVNGKDGREAMYECVTDVLALPGAYRRADGVWDGHDLDNTGAEAMIAMMLNRRETGLHLDFRAVKKNALKQIKKRGDVREFLERVQEAYEEQEGTQVSQFTYVMDGMGFDAPDTQRYCLEGLLPRIIRDTYSAYVAFITTVAGYTTDVAEGEWERSLPYYMVKHHSDKLGLIRSQSASYRELVLRNYAYMRNAKKDSFYNNKLNRSLWALQVGGGSGGSSMGGGGADKAKCTTCQRTNLHPHGSACPLGVLTAGERVKLLASLNYRQQQKAAKHIKQLFGQNANQDHAEAIEAAREIAKT
jgi:hypothetical protein